MPKSILRVISFILATLICIFAGVAFGIQIQLNTAQNRYGTEILQSSKIAIVNQDMGVTYSERAVNFAEELINTLPNHYILMSKAEAEYNIKAGNLAATITFPNNFSENIAGINISNPQKASFTFTINDKLSQKDTIGTIINIMDLETQVSESISYMFVASIFNELHVAQENVTDIMNESGYMVENVTGFQKKDFYSPLEISSVDFKYPETQIASFAKFLSDNGDLLSSADANLKKTIEGIEDGYREVSSQGEASFGSLSRISETIDGIELLPEFLEKTVVNQTTGETVDIQYRDYFDFVEVKTDEKTTELLDKLEVEISLAHDNILVSLGASNFGSLVFKKVQPSTSEEIALGLSLDIELEQLYEKMYTEVVNDFKANIILGLSTDDALILNFGFSSGDVGTDIATLGLSIELYLDNSLPQYPNPAVESYIAAAKRNILLNFNKNTNTLLERQMADDVGRTEIFMKKYIGRQENTVNINFNRLIVPLARIENNTKTAFSNLRNYISKNETNMMKLLNDAYNDADKSISGFESVMIAFEIFKYYDDNQGEIQNLYDKIDTNLKEWDEDINKIIIEREELLSLSYSEYMENIQLIMEETGLSKEAASAILLEEIETMLVSQIGHNENIEKLTNIFANKLPNSHVGTQGNTDLYNFIVSPVNADDTTQNLTTAGAFVPPEVASISSVYLPVTIIGIILFILLIILITYDLIKLYKARKN